MTIFHLKPRKKVTFSNFKKLFAFIILATLFAFCLHLSTPASAAETAEAYYAAHVNTLW